MDLPGGRRRTPPHLALDGLRRVRTVRRPARAAAHPSTDPGVRLHRVITAIVLIAADVATIPEVAEKIAEIDGVTEVYSVTGDVDLIAMVRVREHERLADVIADQVNKVPGVLTTETHIAFRAYTKHDLDAAFALGFEDGS